MSPVKVALTFYFSLYLLLQLYSSLNILSGMRELHQLVVWKGLEKNSELICILTFVRFCHKLYKISGM